MILGCQLIIECGCDEAGRGAGAAEVYVGAVILDPEHLIEGLADFEEIVSRQKGSPQRGNQVVRTELVRS